MNALAKLLANFEPPAQKVVAVAVKTPENQLPSAAVVSVTSSSSDNPQVCEKCDGRHQWKTRHGDEWHCWKCRPPAVPELVAAVRGTQASLIKEKFASRANAVAPTAGRISYTTPKDRCTGCRGALFTETTRSDGSWDVTCWVCGKRKEGSDG
jgi:hypothetical protein